MGKYAQEKIGCCVYEKFYIHILINLYNIYGNSTIKGIVFKIILIGLNTRRKGRGGGKCAETTKSTFFSLPYG